MTDDCFGRNVVGSGGEVTVLLCPEGALVRIPVRLNAPGGILVIIQVFLAVKFPVSGDDLEAVAPAGHSLLGATYLPVVPKMIDSFQITQISKKRKSTLAGFF